MRICKMGLVCYPLTFRPSDPLLRKSKYTPGYMHDAPAFALAFKQIERLGIWSSDS